MTPGPVLLGDGPVTSVDDYVEAGGGKGLAAATARSPEWVVAELERSGLRGRGGAGFPTGAKWRAIRSSPCPTRYVVCNAAEGEPATFKDRWLLRRNPYLVLEGLAIASLTVDARRAFVAVKERYRPEVARLVRARDEMRRAGIAGPVEIEIVEGPDEYLYGEEKALLEVVEGGAPLPRIFPPYVVGLFAGPGSPNPTAVNNVETLANVPAILALGAERFRSSGCDSSPGTMVFTLCGDVTRPGLYELPLGVTVQTLLDAGGGPTPGRVVKALFPGASGAVLGPGMFDVPLDFDAMRSAGTLLGSAGFAVYDDSACMVAAALSFTRFLSVESCAQCPACKHGSADITAALERIQSGAGTTADLDTVRARCRTVSGGQRCALPTGAAALVGSVLAEFEAEFTDHLGRGCPLPRVLPVPKLTDYDEAAGRFDYDLAYASKQPDWSYA